MLKIFDDYMCSEFSLRGGSRSEKRCVQYRHVDNINRQSYILVSQSIIKVINFCVDLSFSSNVKCYKNFENRFPNAKCYKILMIIFPVKYRLL